jgi:hypothetical protein
MNRIRKNVSNKTFMKLFAMYSATINMRTNRRPDDYPNEPYVALVVGNMASRGITIQDPYIDLVCTSFVFTDLNDTLQRGARSTQKFGRACGNLFCKYEEERVPIVVATRKIVEAALANYNAVNENSKNIKNGQHISLRYYISAEDWKVFTSDAKDTIKSLIKKKTKDDKDTEERLQSMKKTYNKSGTMVHNMINMYIANDFKPLHENNLIKSSKTDSICMKHYNTWDEKYHRYKIIESDGKHMWSLRPIIREYLNI